MTGNFSCSRLTYYWVRSAMYINLLVHRSRRILKRRKRLKNSLRKSRTYFLVLSFSWTWHLRIGNLRLCLHRHHRSVRACTGLYNSLPTIYRYFYPILDSFRTKLMSSSSAFFINILRGSSVHRICFFYAYVQLLELSGHWTFDVLISETVYASQTKPLFDNLQLG